MKQFVPDLFRRRSNKNKASKADANSSGLDSTGNSFVDLHTIEEVKIVHGDHPRDIIVTKGDCNGTTGTVSTLANDRQEVTMKMSESLLREDGDERSIGSLETAHPSDEKSVGVAHLPLREQMRYKNQLYFLRKDLAEDSPHRQRSRLVSMYESNDRGVDWYAAGINKHRDSPNAVDEFESTHMYENMRDCDSGKEASSRFKNPRSLITGSLNDDDTRTNISSLLFNYDKSTSQSSSLFDDEDQTNLLSSTIDPGASEGSFNYESLGPATLGGGLSSTEGESLFTSLEDGTSTSYVFQLVDDNKQRNKYQMGVGQDGAMSKIRKVMSTARTTSITNSGSWLDSIANSGSWLDQTVAAAAPRKSSDDDTAFVGDSACPIRPEILEEAYGWGEDAKSALTEVLHAFFISPEDIDLLADRLQDAKLELVEMYHDQTNCKRNRSYSP